MIQMVHLQQATYLLLTAYLQYLSNQLSLAVRRQRAHLVSSYLSSLHRRGGTSQGLLKFHHRVCSIEVAAIMLCHLCRQIFRSTPKLSTWKLYNPVVYPHHPDVQALQDSVSRNCHLCTMLHDALYRDSLAKPAEKLSLEYEIHNDDPEEFDIVFGYRRDSQETRGLIMFYLLPCIGNDLTVVAPDSSVSNIYRWVCR